MGLEEELKAQTQECFRGLSKRLHFWIASTCSSQMILKHQLIYPPPLPVSLLSSVQMKNNVNEVLPRHLIGYILSKLTSQELLKARRVCRAWNQLIDEDRVTPWSVTVDHEHLDQPAFTAWIEDPLHRREVLHLHLEGSPSPHSSKYPLRGNAWTTEHLSVPRRMGFLSWLPSLENLRAFKSTLPLDRTTEARLIPALPTSLEDLSLLLRDQDSISFISFRNFKKLKVLSIQTVRYGSLSLPLESLPSSLQILDCKLEGFGGDWAAGQCPIKTAATLPNLEVLASLEVCANQSLADCAMAFTGLKDLGLTLCPFPHDVGDLFRIDLGGLSNLVMLENLHLDLRAGLTSVGGIASVGKLSHLKSLHLSAPTTGMVEVLFSRRSSAQPVLSSNIRCLHLSVRDDLDLGLLATGLSHVAGLEELKLWCRHLAANEEASGLFADKPYMKRVSVTCRMAMPTLHSVVAQLFPLLQHRRQGQGRVASTHRCPAQASLIEFQMQCDQTILARFQACNLQKRAKRRGVRLQIKSRVGAQVDEEASPVHQLGPPQLQSEGAVNRAR
eukprot:jgi/Botrbrau1/20706/Bobra.0058s0035.1